MDLHQEMITQLEHRWWNGARPSASPDRSAVCIYLFPFGTSTYSPCGFHVDVAVRKGWRCCSNKQPLRSSTACPHTLPRGPGAGGGDSSDTQGLSPREPSSQCANLQSLPRCSDSQVLPPGRDTPSSTHLHFIGQYRAPGHS